MDDARDKDLAELAAELSEEAAQLGEAAGKVAMSAMLATTLSAALQQPPNTDLMELPEAMPIVRVLEDEKEEVIPPADEPDDDAAAVRRQRLRKLLKYLLVALLLIATLLFGALKGCASCTAGVLLPSDDARQEQEAQDS